MAEPPLEVGDLTLHLQAQVLTGPSGSVRLYHRPFRVLECLMREPGSVVALETLLAVLYPDEEPDTAQQVLRNLISNIRTCCRAAGGYNISIDPIPMRGYRIAVVRYIDCRFRQ